MLKEHWTYKKLDEVCEILNGFAFKSDEYKDNGIRVMRITNVQKGAIVDDDPKFFPLERMDEVSKYILREGDVLMSLTGNVGRVGIITSKFLPAALNQRVACLRLRDDEVNKKYLFHILNSDSFEKDCIFNAAGIAQKNMSTKWLEQYAIPVPPLETQSRIVSELDLLQSIIDKQQAQLKELDKLAQAVFYDMFGEDKAIEQKWEKCRVGDIYKFQYGKGNNIPEDRGEYPCYGSNGVVGHHIIYNSEDAPIIGHIGAYAGIVNWGAGKHYVTYNGVICKLKDNRNNPIYGYYMLKSQDYLNAAKRGGAQPFVSYDLLEQPTIFIPPCELQQSFAAKMESIEKQKAAISQSIAETQNLFDYTMDKYFG